MDHAVLHLAVVDDEHHQHAVPRQRQELDVPQRHLLRARHGDETRHARDPRQQLRGGLDEFLRRQVRIQPAANAPHDVRIHRRHGNQAVDEKAQALVRRHPPGGGMRARHQPPRFEFRHDVAHRRRAHRHVRSRSERPRRHRRTVGHIVLDQHLEELLRAFAHLALRCAVAGHPLLRIRRCRSLLYTFGTRRSPMPC